MSKESKEKAKMKRKSDFDTEVELSECMEAAVKDMKTNYHTVSADEQKQMDMHLKTLTEAEEKITKARKEHKRSIFFKILCFVLSALLMVLGFIIPGAGNKITDIGTRFLNRKDS